MKLQEWKKTVLKNYKAKVKPLKSEVDHVLDFLKAHPNFKLSERVAFTQVKEKADQWVEELNKKNADLEAQGETEVIMEFPNGMKFVRLLDQTAKDWEGLHMRHCVASYTGHPGIYSLRDEKGIPHCTFEVDKSRYVRQIKGKGNGKVSPKYTEEAIKALSHFRRVSSGDLYNIGYVELGAYCEKILENHFEGYAMIENEGKKLFHSAKSFKMKSPFKDLNAKLFTFLCEGNLCTEGVAQMIENGIEDCLDEDAIYNYAKEAVLKNRYYLLEALLKNPVKFKFDAEEIITNLHMPSESRTYELLIKKNMLKDWNTSKLISRVINNACTKGRIDLLKSFIKLGLKVENAVTVGLSPIETAAYHNKVEIMKTLIEHNCKVVCEKDSVTKKPLCFALNYAVNHNNEEMVKLLLANGASPKSVHSQLGISLADYAKQKNLSEIASLLNS